MVHRLLKVLRKFSSGSINPIFPAIGSTITAAISSPNFVKAFLSSEALLYSSVIVNLESSSGIPGESGTPSVAAPDPAFTNKESTCPW